MAGKVVDGGFHGNAGSLSKSARGRGPSGNLIMSIRHLNQIIAISPDFSTVMWRLGGPGNDFLFPDPSDQFRHQHTAREIVADERILLFDNGNFRPEDEGGVYSRGLELDLDFSTNPPTATKRWERVQDLGDGYSFCCSSTARLDNGNTVVMFGSQNGADPCCTTLQLVEADNTGATVAKIEMHSPGKNIQYRAYPADGIFGETER